MTINDLCCDFCGRLLAAPGGAARFGYHPGAPQFRDDSGLACGPCWTDAVGQLGEPTARSCAVCGKAVTRTECLHVRRLGDRRAWRLCASHAAGFLNRLRTVEPKLDPAAFRFPAASASRPSGE
ncbi:MAG TPA: hypothetical protein VMU94_30955 [Streptosporangiaceae bacterium]|nr:hypothetical protein [Streptosporangiaceae bacterium]